MIGADPRSDNCRFSAIVRKVLQLSERGSQPIIRVTDHQCPDDRCPAVPHTSSTHLCPAVRPPVPSSAPTCATQQCH
ncbi:unnamed protein product, partial [Staurois parvus]